MKINSQDLYEFINNLATNEKVKFNVYCDDQYVTQIYWNGECFEWTPGLFSSEAFFNPLYDFIVIEEEKQIDEQEQDNFSGLKVYQDGQLLWYLDDRIECRDDILTEEDKKIDKEIEWYFIEEKESEKMKIAQINMNFKILREKLIEIIDKLNEVGK